jgi:hypothetical protein
MNNFIRPQFSNRQLLFNSILLSQTKLVPVVFLLSISACSFLPKTSTQKELARPDPNTDLAIRDSLPKTTQKPIAKEESPETPRKEYPAFPKFDDMQITDPNSSQSPKPAIALRNSTRIERSASKAAVEIPNPVDIVRQAGARPPGGASRGEYYFGYWTAKGDFPLREGRYISDNIYVYAFPSKQSRDEKVADEVPDDKKSVLISNDKPFYATVNTFSDQGFAVDPEVIAGRLNATIKP